MKPKKQAPKVKLPKGFTIKTGLDEEYADQPFFKEKTDRVDQFLKKFGPPNAKPH